MSGRDFEGFFSDDEYDVEYDSVEEYEPVAPDSDDSTSVSAFDFFSDNEEDDSDVRDSATVFRERMAALSSSGPDPDDSSSGSDSSDDSSSGDDDSSSIDVSSFMDDEEDEDDFGFVLSDVSGVSSSDSSDGSMVSASAFIDDEVDLDSPARVDDSGSTVDSAVEEGVFNSSDSGSVGGSGDDSNGVSSSDLSAGDEFAVPSFSFDDDAGDADGDVLESSGGGVSGVDFSLLMDDEEDDFVPVRRSKRGLSVSSRSGRSGGSSSSEGASGDSGKGVSGGLDSVVRAFDESVPDTPESVAKSDFLRDVHERSGDFRRRESARVADRDEFVDNDKSVPKKGRKFTIHDSQSDIRQRDAYEMVVDSSGRRVNFDYHDDGTDVHFGVQKRSRRKRRGVFDNDNVGIASAEKDFYLQLNRSVKRLRNDPDVASAVDIALSRDDVGVRARRTLEQVGDDAFKKNLHVGSYDAKDMDVLRFLALFKYATSRNIMELLGVSKPAATTRLNKLSGRGLVSIEKIHHIGNLYFLTEAGMILSGVDVKRTTKSSLNDMLFRHTFAVNHTAANLWSGGLNVLNLDDFPVNNRRDASGNIVAGETLISELQIQSSLSRMRGRDSADVYRPRLLSLVSDSFEKWENDPNRLRIPSPENRKGNEFMWALVPRAHYSRGSYHVPDLVVVRPRSKDGSPNSIAVEVELDNKNEKEYEKTLKSYLDDERIYKKVVWVCNRKGTALKLEKVARSIGLAQRGRFGVYSILTQNGFFKGTEMWKL